jgi:Rieske 2Fe-2S family protein
LIFLHVGNPNSSFTTDARPIVDRLASWSLGDLVLAATRRYDVRANWKLLFQNYNECYHCPTVHPALNRLTPYKTATNDLTSGPILGGPMELAAGFETVSRDGKLVAERFPQLTDAESRRVYYYTIFPTLFVSAHPDYVMVHILNRRDVALTEVTCHFLIRGSEPEPDPGSLARATDLWDEVNRQDWRVCELTQMGVESPACRPGPYSRLESMVYAFDRHYREVMGLRDHR